MQYCEKCGVNVAGSHMRCPLCQGTLAGERTEAEDVFPHLSDSGKSHGLFYRLLVFATVVTAVICVSINFLLPTRIWWSGFVVGGMVSAWLLVAVALRKRHNIPKTILRLVVWGSLLAAAWDQFTGAHGWAIGYVIPILCSGAMVALMVLARVLRMQITDYMFYLAMDILFGILPAVFYLAGFLHGTLIPSLVCVAVSVVSLAAVLVFQGRELRAEIGRRLHF